MGGQPRTAITRRDDLLTRTKGLSLLVAGAAGAVSVGLAAVLGLSIPGKAATTKAQTPTGQGQPGQGQGQRQGQPPAGSHRSGQAGKHSKHGTRHRHLAPPAQPPSKPKSQAPPVTSSGAS